MPENQETGSNFLTTEQMKRLFEDRKKEGGVWGLYKSKWQFYKNKLLDYEYSPAIGQIEDGDTNDK